MGLGRDICVGILPANSYEWLTEDLALIHLGAIAVPVPEEEPQE